MKHSSKLLLLLSAVLVIAFGVSGCKSEPHSADIHIKRAMLHLSKGKLHKAQAEAFAAIKSDPARIDSYMAVAAVFEARGHYIEAVKYLELMLKQAEQSKLERKLYTQEKSMLMLQIGMLHQQAGNLADAEKYYKSALSLEPDNPEMLNALGYFYAEEGINLNLAIKLTRRAVELAPDSGHIVDSLGWAQYQQGRYDTAVKTLQRAVKLSPDVAEIRYHLGAAYAKKGLKTAALVELRKALLIQTELTEAAKMVKRLQ